jgi:hypothetical protein
MSVKTEAINSDTASGDNYMDTPETHDAQHEDKPLATGAEGGPNGKPVDPEAVSEVAAKVLPDSEKTKSDIQGILANGNGYNSEESDKAALEAVYLNSQVMNQMVPPETFSSMEEAGEFWGQAKTLGVAGDGKGVKDLIESVGGNTYGLSEDELAATTGIDEHHTLHQNGGTRDDPAVTALFNDAHKTMRMTADADGLSVGDGYGNDNGGNAQHGAWEDSKHISDLLGIGNDAMA